MKHAIAFCVAVLAAFDVMASSIPAPPDSTRDIIAEIPHRRVAHHVARFTGEKRSDFGTYLKRMRRYQPMIADMLRDRGMPQDLIYLAMVESGFDTEARSHAGAVGIWQLGAETARRYGLLVDDADDERRDAKKSTIAALEHLSDLYDRFGSWYLAAAAYNGGENRVARLMKAVKGTERGTDADYYRIRGYLPRETREYVPQMIAAAKIGQDRTKYGF